MKKSAQHDYLQELKTVSALLAKQKSWRDHNYRDIFKSVALLSFSFTTVLDDYIRSEGEYGCVIRDKVFHSEATKRGFDTKQNLSTADVRLATNLLVYKKKPHSFNDIEGNCYKRVRLLGEARANMWDVECTILNAEPYDPDTSDRYDEKNRRTLYIKSAEDDDLVQQVDAFNPLRRPAELRYIQGMTQYTHAIHTILENYHRNNAKLVVA